VTFLSSKFGSYRSARGQIAVCGDTDAGDYWIIVALHNFDALRPHKKSLRAFDAIMEEVNVSSAHARQLFGLMAQQKLMHRFFESKCRFKAARGGSIPLSMIDDWNDAMSPFLSVGSL
jgi:hypothetical protein